jgi:hypothetical protein
MFSVRFSNCSFFIGVCILLLLSPFYSSAQNSSPGCGKGEVFDQVKDLAHEPEAQIVYNPLTDRDEFRYVWRWNLRWVWKCVPAPPHRNSSSPKAPATTEPSSKAGQNRGLPPYAGRYSGDWLTTYSDVKEQRGEWTFGIDIFGTISGEELNTTFNVTGEIRGSIREDGYIELSIQYRGDFKDSPPAIIRGYVAKDGNRHLKGTLSQYDGEKITSVFEVDVAPTTIE